MIMIMAMGMDDHDDDNADEGYRVYNEEEDIPARVVVNVRVTKLPWWWKYGTQMGDFLILSFFSWIPTPEKCRKQN